MKYLLIQDKLYFLLIIIRFVKLVFYKEYIRAYVNIKERFCVQWLNAVHVQPLFRFNEMRNRRDTLPGARCVYFQG